VFASEGSIEPADQAGRAARTARTAPAVRFEHTVNAHVQRLRVAYFNGPGIAINAAQSCIFDSLTAIECGSLSAGYALALNDSEIGCTNNYFGHLQVELSSALAVSIGWNAVTNQFDLIHSERLLDPTMSAPAWLLQGYNSRFETIGLQVWDSAYGGDDDLGRPYGYSPAAIAWIGGSGDTTYTSLSAKRSSIRTLWWTSYGNGVTLLNPDIGCGSAHSFGGFNPFHVIGGRVRQDPTGSQAATTYSSTKII
jgi:hypothetical protein